MGVRNRGDLADLFVCRIGERQGSDAHERTVAVVAFAGATFAGVQGAGSRAAVIENAVDRILATAIQLTNLSRMSAVSICPISLIESQVASVMDVSSLQVPAGCPCVP